MIFHTSGAKQPTFLIHSGWIDDMVNRGEDCGVVYIESVYFTALSSPAGDSAFLRRDLAIMAAHMSQNTYKVHPAPLDKKRTLIFCQLYQYRSS